VKCLFPIDAIAGGYRAGSARGENNEKINTNTVEGYYGVFKRGIIVYQHYACHRQHRARRTRIAGRQRKAPQSSNDCPRVRAQIDEMGKGEKMSRAEEEALLRFAREIAVRHEAQIPQLNNDLIDIEAEKTEILRELHTARLATKRASDYNPVFGGDLRCPGCWIYNETSSKMHPIPSAKGSDDWQCDSCKEIFTT
jgi:hypothetical protein